MSGQLIFHQPQVGDHVVVSDGINQDQFIVTQIEGNLAYIQSETDPDAFSAIEFGWKIAGSEIPYEITFIPAQPSKLALPQMQPPGRTTSPTRTPSLTTSPTRTISPVRSPVRSPVQTTSPTRTISPPAFSPGRPSVIEFGEPVPLEAIEEVVVEEIIESGQTEVVPDDTVYGQGCVTSLIGRSHEDRHVSGILNGTVRFYAVFDGHGGKQTADLLKAQFPNRLAQALSRVDMTRLSAVEVAVQKAIDDFEEKVLRPAEVRDGSTMVLALITDDYVYLVNLGDSRAILFNDLGFGYPPAVRSVRIIGETVDHEPFSEKDRIESVGGAVYYVQGIWRVAGEIAIARSFGDFRYKMVNQSYSNRGPVSLLADVTRYNRRVADPNQEPLFLLLASDGLFEHAYRGPEPTNQEIVDQISTRFTMSGTPILELTSPTLLPRNKEERDILRSCQRVAESARARATDDITVMVVKI